jgi:hypothetical protein
MLELYLVNYIVSYQIGIYQKKVKDVRLVKISIM